MEDRENTQIEEKLKQLAKEYDIVIPESISPENIKKRIEETKFNNPENEKKRRNNMSGKILRIATTFAAAAATIAIVIGTGNTGILKIGNKARINENTENGSIKAKEVKGIKQFKTYKEIFEALEKYGKKNVKERERYEEELSGFTGADVAADGAVTTEVPSEETAESEKAKGDYSETNARTEGVKESDIIKTDGKNIYTLKYTGKEDYCIEIVRANNGNPVYAGRVELPKDKRAGFYAINMFVEGNILAVIGNTYEEADREDIYNYRDYRTWYTRDYNTTIMFYDVSDPANAKFICKHDQTGEYNAARMKDGIIYLFSQEKRYDYYTYYDYMPLEENVDEDIKKKAKEDTKDKESDYREMAPKVDGKAVLPENIYVPENTENYGYTIISSINIKNPEKLSGSFSVMDYADNLYVSENNIYFLKGNFYYDKGKSKTKIFSYSYDNGVIKVKAGGEVDGIVKDDYSVDEYKGFLRIVTTVDQDLRAVNNLLYKALEDIGFIYNDKTVRSNGLYILDEDLKQVGKIKDLAKGEMIKSAKFMGDIVYFVTFRNTDPLFAADISDPAKPEIKSMLKVSGFSTYLHDFGKGLLFGIGQEADEKYGGTKGLKISMFDINDMGNVKELTRKVLGGFDSASEAEYNRNAILVNAEKNLIGFSINAYSYKNGKSMWGNKYTVYGYNPKKGFYERFSYDFAENNEGYYNIRGLYIGKYFYMVGAYSGSGKSKIFAFDMETDTKVGELVR